MLTNIKIVGTFHPLPTLITTTGEPVIPRVGDKIEESDGTVYTVIEVVWFYDMVLDLRIEIRVLKDV